MNPETDLGPRGISGLKDLPLDASVRSGHRGPIIRNAVGVGGFFGWLPGVAAGVLLRPAVCEGLVGNPELCCAVPLGQRDRWDKEILGVSVRHSLGPRSGRLVVGLGIVREGASAGIPAGIQCSFLCW